MAYAALTRLYSWIPTPEDEREMFRIVSLDHIGIAVNDLDASARFWTELLPGITIHSRNTLELVRAENYMLTAGNAQIELLAPMEGDTALTGFLQRRGEGFYFLTCLVDDILEGCSEMEARGMRIVESWGPRAESRHVFVHPRDGHGIYLQLVEWGKSVQQGSITTRVPMPTRPAKSDPANGFHVVALDHIVHGVRDLDEVAKWWQEVFRVEPLFSEPLMEKYGVKDLYLNFGNAWVELMQPLEGEEGLTRFLERKGEGVFFIAFEVENLAMGLDHLKAKGVRLVELWGDAREEGLVFLHPKDCNGVYICLVDSTRARQLRMGEGVAQGRMVRETTAAS